MAETETGFQRRQPEHQLDQAKLRKGWRAFTRSGNTSARRWRSRLANSRSIASKSRFGHTHWAAVMIGSCAVRTRRVFFCGLGCRDKLVSLEGLLDEVGHRPGTALRQAYSRRWNERTLGEPVLVKRCKGSQRTAPEQGSGLRALPTVRNLPGRQHRGVHRRRTKLGLRDAAANDRVAMVIISCAVRVLMADDANRRGFADATNAVPFVSLDNTPSFARPQPRPCCPPHHDHPRPTRIADSRLQPTIGHPQSPKGQADFPPGTPTTGTDNRAQVFERRRIRNAYSTNRRCVSAAH